MEVISCTSTSTTMAIPDKVHQPSKFPFPRKEFGEFGYEGSCSVTVSMKFGCGESTHDYTYQSHLPNFQVLPTPLQTDVA